jgi:SAM-dependent methyltransferase
MEAVMLEALQNNFRLLSSNWTRLPASIPIGSDDGIPIPPQDNRARIASLLAAADPSGAQFAFWAKCAAAEVVKIAETYGAPVADELAVMDWGVGCGRIARCLPANWRRLFVGLDVDHKNIEWCRSNFPFGEFHVVSPYPDGRVHPRDFDIVYSSSVMTHLVRADQELWIQKVAEVTKPGGLMLITVHGFRHTGEWMLSPAHFNTFLERGEYGGFNPNSDIADTTPPGYYTDVCNTPKFIHEVWGRYVDVMDIIPAGMGEQDVVVARRKH